MIDDRTAQNFGVYVSDRHTMETVVCWTIPDIVNLGGTRCTDDVMVDSCRLRLLASLIVLLHMLLRDGGETGLSTSWSVNMHIA